MYVGRYPERRGYIFSVWVECIVLVVLARGQSQLKTLSLEVSVNTFVLQGSSSLFLKDLLPRRTHWIQVYWSIDLSIDWSIDWSLFFTHTCICYMELCSDPQLLAEWELPCQTSVNFHKQSLWSLWYPPKILPYFNKQLRVYCGRV